MKFIKLSKNKIKFLSILLKSGLLPVFDSDFLIWPGAGRYLDFFVTSCLILKFSVILSLLAYKFWWEKGSLIKNYAVTVIMAAKLTFVPMFPRAVLFFLVGSRGICFNDLTDVIFEFSPFIIFWYVLPPFHKKPNRQTWTKSKQQKINWEIFVCVCSKKQQIYYV